MKEVKHYSELTVSTVKALYDKLKKDRLVLSQAEFAKKIEKDRTYLNRIINGHEPLTDTVKLAIFETFIDTTGSVGRMIPMKGKKEEIFRQQDERLLRIEAHLEVYSDVLASILSKNDPLILADKKAELKKAVQSAANRRLDELNNK